MFFSGLRLDCYFYPTTGNMILETSKPVDVSFLQSIKEIHFNAA